MSTSTSGLSDYVESAKFRYLNDMIKYFEKNFNNLDLVNGINNIKARTIFIIIIAIRIETRALLKRLENFL